MAGLGKRRFHILHLSYDTNGGLASLKDHLLTFAHLSTGTVQETGVF